MADTKAIQLTMPIEMLEEVNAVAKSIGVKRNPFILMAVRQYLDTRKVTANMDGVKDLMLKKIEEEFEKAAKENREEK